MRYAMWAGCAWLGLSVLGCGSTRARAPLLDEKPVAVSAGEGGGAEIDTGQWATTVYTPQVQRERRQLYGQVARQLGLEWHPSMRGPRAESGPGLGGSGQAGSERRSCAEILAANEPAAMISGTLDFALDGVLTIRPVGEPPMKLRSDASTCAVQGRKMRLPQSLLVGTEVRASYVMEDGLPTARVVLVEPVRPTH